VEKKREKERAHIDGLKESCRLLFTGTRGFSTLDGIGKIVRAKCRKEREGGRILRTILWTSEE